jgi:hypothetical protein
MFNSFPVALVLQSMAILISASSVIATIIWNSRVTRRRTTFEMLLAEQTNPLLLDFRSKMQAAAAKGELEAHANDENFYFSPASFFLVSTMNRCELVAIGIKKGTIDKSIYKRYWGHIYVRDWMRCRESVFIRRQLKSEPSMFEDFEQLALKWGA